MEGTDRSGGDGGSGTSRRALISTAVAAVPVAVAGGMAIANSVRFLNPKTELRERETFVAFPENVPDGGTLDVTLPDGRRVQVRRVADGFAGFSNVCPHLGCRVNWEGPKEGETDPRKKDGYFRCPCHEGLFTPDGVAFQGPPADAKQVLERVPLVLRDGALYVRFTEEVS